MTSIVKGKSARIPTHIELPTPPSSYVIPFGQGSKGRVFSLDLMTYPHLLLAGAAGSGKSIVINTIMAHLLTCAEDWHIYGTDLNQVELSCFERFDRVKMIATTHTEAIEIVEHLVDELGERYRRMEEEGVVNYAVLKDPCKPVMFIIDEVALLFGNRSNSEKALREDFAQLARLGRAAGIHIVLSAQRLDAYNIPISDFDARIVMGQSSHIVSQIMFDTNDAVTLPKVRGRGYAKIGGQVEEFQSYYTPYTWFNNLK